MKVYEVILETYSGEPECKEFKIAINNKEALVIDDEYFVVLTKGYNGNVAPSTERFGEKWGGRCYAKTYEEAKTYAIDRLNEEKTYMEDYIERAKFRIGQCDKLINILTDHTEV